jgi:hypothetical protein
MLRTCEPCKLATVHLATVVSDRRLWDVNDQQPSEANPFTSSQDANTMCQAGCTESPVAAVLCHACHPNRRAGPFQFRTSAIGADFCRSTHWRCFLPQNLESHGFSWPFLA